MSTYYMEPNAVIEKSYDFDTDSFLVVFNGYIASRKNFISVEKAYQSPLVTEKEIKAVVNFIKNRKE